jgi:thiol-disulfide isomerase/thioredoxin
MIEPSAVINITSLQQYENILRDSARLQNGVQDIVIIKFSKKTCPHCIHVQPYYEDFAKKDRAFISSYLVETTDYPEIAQVEGVRRVPDFVVYVHGRRRDDLRLTNSDENELEYLFDTLHKIHRQTMKS